MYFRRSRHPALYSVFEKKKEIFFVVFPRKFIVSVQINFAIKADSILTFQILNRTKYIFFIINGENVSRAFTRQDALGERRSKTKTLVNSRSQSQCRLVERNYNRNYSTVL